MRPTAAARFRLLGWPLSLSGLFLVVDTIREGAQGIVRLVMPELFRQFAAATGGSVWTGWIPELTFALCLASLMIWFTTSLRLRITLGVLIACLLVHAVTGFFYGSFPSLVILATSQSISFISFVLAGIWILTRSTPPRPVAVVLAILLFLLALGDFFYLSDLALYELIDSIRVLINTRTGDLLYLVYIVVDVVGVLVEIVAGLLQAASGIVVLASSRSRASAQLTGGN